jgi:hypothetical protein
MTTLKAGNMLVVPSHWFVEIHAKTKSCKFVSTARVNFLTIPRSATLQDKQEALIVISTGSIDLLHNISRFDRPLDQFENMLIDDFLDFIFTPKPDRLSQD